VRLIFRLYNEYRCVRELKSELEARGLKTKTWTSGSGRAVGGKPFSGGHLYYLLKNRVYVGEAVHRGVSHAGQHEAIIDQDTWHRTEAILKNNRVGRKQGRGAENPSPLAGILFDELGSRLTPSHTGKRGARLRF
jgi:hypothetical protein